jgi:uncharacterized protein
MKLLQSLRQQPANQLFTRVHPKAIWSRVVQFPLIRLLISLLFFVPLFALDKLLKETLIARLSGNLQIAVKYLEAALFFVLFLLVFRWYTKAVERRPALELSGPGWFREFGLGFLITAAMMTALVATLYALGYLTFTGLNPNPRVVVDLLVKFLMTGLVEELLFRLVLFKLTEEWLGTWVAFIFQASFFGFAHLANDNASAYTSICVAIEGGVVLTGAYLYTRRLWFAFGLHTAWNYLQSGVFSIPVSGGPSNGYFKTTLSGPELISGGSFGVEGSILAVILCAVVGGWFVLAAYRSGQFIPPSWIRKRIESDALTVPAGSSSYQDDVSGS